MIDYQEYGDAATTARICHRWCLHAAIACCWLLSCITYRLDGPFTQSLSLVQILFLSTVGVTVDDGYLYRIYRDLYCWSIAGEFKIK